MNNYIEHRYFIALIVGFCNSGKTYSLKYTIKTIPKYDFYIVISNTAEFNNDYIYLQEMGVKHRIYNASKCNEIIKTILEIQEKNHKEQKKQSIMLIFDDCLGSLNNSDVFKKLCSTYRHFSIAMCVITQFCNASQTYIRELANYVFCFDQRTEQSKKAIYQSYFSDIGTFNEFKQLFQGLKQYQFFLIDRIRKRRFKMICPSENKSTVIPQKQQENLDFYKNL